MKRCGRAGLCACAALVAACGGERGESPAPAEPARSAAVAPAMPEECGPMGAAVAGSTPTARIENIGLRTDAYAISVTAIPPDIVSGELFSFRISGRGAGPGGGEPLDAGISLAVTAAMPEHEHGMDTVSRVRREGDGFLVEGMLLQMPGRWEVYFDLTDRGITERAVLELNVR